jgi:hypothetical protein
MLKNDLFANTKSKEVIYNGKNIFNLQVANSLIYATNPQQQSIFVGFKKTIFLIYQFSIKIKSPHNQRVVFILTKRDPLFIIKQLVSVISDRIAFKIIDILLQTEFFFVKNRN